MEIIYIPQFKINVLYLVRSNLMNKIQFPKQFFWGCATSSHQIEGNTCNDWSEWENSLKRISALTKLGHNPNDFISQTACNSYEMDNADIQSLEYLGVNSYRFSIEWSRIEPEKDKFSTEAAEYYLNFVKKLRAHGIEPFVTLWHWPLPLWLRDEGGWQAPGTVERFNKYVDFIARYLNSEVNFWITLNEPEIYSHNSYLLGKWPPQKKNPLALWQVLQNLIKGHKVAYKTLKQIDSNNQVGLAKNNICFEMKKDHLWNKSLKKLADWWWNDFFINKTVDSLDFIGLNFYFHNTINWWFNHGKYDRYSDIDWALVPEGIYWVLNDLKRYNKPIYITENGLADKADKHRIWYIENILKNVHRAINDNIPVKGYFHWSLLDNFEWDLGFKPRFGLFEVDYQSFARTPRPAADYYSQVCKNNSLSIE